MYAFQETFIDPVADGKKPELIVQQEEKIVDADGNVKVKQRTLTNPTEEELEEKTLDELEDDVDDPVGFIIRFLRDEFELNFDIEDYYDAEY